MSERQVFQRIRVEMPLQTSPPSPVQTRPFKCTNTHQLPSLLQVLCIFYAVLVILFIAFLVLEHKVEVNSFVVSR